MKRTRLTCWICTSLMATVMAAGSTAAEIEVRTQGWSSDAAGFSEFNAELMAQDDANLLKFPGASLMRAEGVFETSNNNYFNHVFTFVYQI